MKEITWEICLIRNSIFLDEAAVDVVVNVVDIFGIVVAVVEDVGDTLNIKLNSVTHG